MSRLTATQYDWPLKDRLLAVGWDVTPEGCWEWRGDRNEQGYGRLTARRLGLYKARAHRLMYATFVGPIPAGLEIRHYVCDNPPCVNPDHLRPGTHAENQRDMADRGRRLRTTCPSGHDRTKPGAVSVIRRSGRPDERICVECARARRRRHEAARREAGR